MSIIKKKEAVQEVNTLVSEELEAAVLGVIINNCNIFYKVCDQLSESCFSTKLHIDIYNDIKSSLNDNNLVSPHILMHKYKDVRDENGDLLTKNVIGIMVQSAHLHALNIKEHVDTLVDLSKRRGLQQRLQDGLAAVQNHDKDITSLLSNISSEVNNLHEQGENDSITEYRDGVMEIYESLKAEEPAYKATTGLKILDEAMAGGIQKGRVYAFLAAAKTGKTMLATTISNHLNKQGHKHTFICAEMGSREIIERMVGQNIGVPTHAFRERGSQELIELLAVEVTKCKMNVNFVDEPGIEFDELKTKIEVQVYKNKIEGFILDYYQLVSGQRKDQTQAQHLEAVANWVHRTCKKHNIWCVMLVQSNDEGKVLGSRGLDRACDQKYLLDRVRDSDGDPVGPRAWMKMKLSRYTPLMPMGDKNMPSIKIHENGTHIVEI